MAHITGFLAATAAQNGRRPLFHCQGRINTAEEVACRVSSLATALQHRLRIQVGERVCLAALATDHSMEALLAISACGAIPALINWRWGASEAAHAVQLVEAAAIVADAACADLAMQLAASCPSLRAVVLLGPVASFPASVVALSGGLSSYSSPGRPLTAAFAESLLTECPMAGAGALNLLCAPGGAALIVFTSGTTGRPKGVVLSHASLHVQCMAKLLVCGYSRSDVYLHAAPLFHIGGLNSALAMLLAGAQHVFLPRFEPAAALTLMHSHNVTSFIAVPAMVADLVAAAAVSQHADSSAATHVTSTALPCVRRILLGGGGTAPALLKAVTALFPAAVVQSAYGMTEAASSITFATLGLPPGTTTAETAAAGAVRSAGPSTIAEGVELPSSGSSSSAPSTATAAAAGVFVGVPPPGIELAVLQAVKGSYSVLPSQRVLQEGAGEVLTRGPHVMLGYWGDQAATAAALLPGGWMRTGDLGHVSQGKLWLLGRAKDMIKSGGENVHASEVEQALLSHPAVAAAAVVGVSDWRLGEAVAAAVVLQQGWSWQGLPCQTLLKQSQQQQFGAQQTHAGSLAAVEAAVAGSGSTAALHGSQQAADREGWRAQACADDLASTLRQETPASRPGTAQSMHEDGSGLVTEVPAAQGCSAQQQQQQQQLQQVAAAISRVEAYMQQYGDLSAGEDPDFGDGFAGNNGSSSGSARMVSGSTLQQHCRQVGLAGFKLPRVFLHCRAASTSETAAIRGAISTGQLQVLPVTAVGKVAKEQLQRLIVQALQQLSAVDTDSTRARARL